MNFSYQYDMSAGVPYLLKPEKTVSMPQWEFDGNEITVAEEPGTDTYSGYQFVGSYTPHEWDINRADGEEYYYGVMSGKVFKAKETTATLKGLRAYFVLPTSANARINISGVEVGIDEIVSSETIIGPVRVYNLQGQYMGNSTHGLSKGLYIINGKKQMVR